MLVKAKMNVKDAAGWHRTGEVFNTDEDLGDAVEVLEKPRRQEPKQEKPAEPVKAAEEPKEEKPKSAPRRKKVSA